MNQLVIVIAVLLAACSRSLPAPARGGGNAPQRIVALTVGAVDTLALLGELHRVVAVEADCFVPGTEDKVHIANDDHSGPSRALNVEAVLALAPDLVIAKDELRAALEGRGLEVLYLSLNNDLGVIEPTVLAIAARVHAVPRARVLLDRMHAAMRAIEQRVASLPRVRVYYEAGQPGRTVGRNTVINDMITLAGGTSIAAGESLANPVLSAEAILAADPEVIVLSPWSDPPAQVAARPGWNRLAAVRSGRVHQIRERDRTVGYPSPSCVGGCEAMLLPWLHPEAVPARGRSATAVER